MIDQPSSADEARSIVQQVVWHQTFEIYPGVTTPGRYAPLFMWDLLRLPDRLDNRRALDIGTSDGYFAMRLDAAGADVVAVDYRPSAGFAVMERCIGKHLDLRHLNIYQLPDAQLGTFDIVLFLGLIYHLPDMLGGLEIVRSLASDKVFIESYVEKFPGDEPMARYLPRDTLAGDPSNFWAPNIACLVAMAQECGIETVRVEQWGDRALLEGRAVKPSNKVARGFRGRLTDPLAKPRD